jgi:hypothetical protein
MGGKRVADDHALDGERLGDIAAGERANDRLGYAELGKRSDVVSSFLSDSGEIQRPLDARSARRERNLSGGVCAEPDPTTVSACVGLTLAKVLPALRLGR